jgi:uncharacterized protein (DUF4415 family)
MTADDAPDLSSPEYHAKFAAVPARRKAKKPTKAHKITLSLAPDVVASIKVSGPGFNRRVEQVLREAGFGAGKTKPQPSAPHASETAASSSAVRVMVGTAPDKSGRRRPARRIGRSGKR